MPFPARRWRVSPGLGRERWRGRWQTQPEEGMISRREETAGGGEGGNGGGCQRTDTMWSTARDTSWWKVQSRTTRTGPCRSTRTGSGGNSLSGCGRCTRNEIDSQVRSDVSSYLGGTEALHPPWAPRHDGAVHNRWKPWLNRFLDKDAAPSDEDSFEHASGTEERGL
jgi:hypothetical protein